MDWDALKSVSQLVVVPLLGIFGYHYKRRIEQLDNFSSDVINIKLENATVKTQLVNINDQLKEMKTLMNILISKLEK